MDCRKVRARACVVDGGGDRFEDCSAVGPSARVARISPGAAMRVKI
jgi:hypothetical protein